MIELENISFEIEEKTILDSINFSLPKGESLIVIGPNGAGKSTLLRIISGYYRNFKGKVFVNGKDIKNYSPVEISRRISFIPQVYSIFFGIKVFDFLLTSRFPHKGFLKDFSNSDIERVKKISEEIGISEFLNRKMDTLSGGELQKVMIASALIQETEIVLFDEPVTFLDPSSQSEVYNLINKLKKSGKTLIIVSHDLNVFSFLKGRVLGLKDGRMVFYMKDFRENGNLKNYLEDIFEVRFFEVVKNGRIFYNFEI